MRVLAPSLGRHVALRSLEDLEQGLLDALARHVPRDRRVVALAADLVHLVDVDDPALGLFLVATGRLVELEDDVLDVLADVARLGQRGRVRDRERDAQQPRQRLREQRLAGARGPDQEDVRLLEFDVGPRPLAEVDSLVVVVDRDGQLLLGLFLADHVVVEQLLEFLGLGQRRLLALLQHPVLGDDVEADVDALVANEDGGARDELLDLSLALAAERAPQRVVATVLLRHDWSFRLGFSRLVRPVRTRSRGRAHRRMLARPGLRGPPPKLCLASVRRPRGARRRGRQARTRPPFPR